MNKNLFLVFLFFILVVGCTSLDSNNSTAKESASQNGNNDAAERDLGANGKFVGTWLVGKSEFKADTGGLWYPEDPLNKVALKPDMTWEDDKGNTGTWSVRLIEDSDWDAWSISWDTSAGKPEKKMVLSGVRAASGFIEEGTRDFFWLFFRFEGDQETPEGWIQLRFEKISDTPTIEKPREPLAPNPSQDAEVAKTKNVPGLESKLVGEYGFGTSRRLVLKYEGKWELTPESGGSSGTWELKDVTREDIDKWMDDGKISDASEILSKKLVLHNRRCSYSKPPETEEIYLYAADEEGAFTSCGTGWFKGR